MLSAGVSEARGLHKAETRVGIFLSPNFSGSCTPWGEYIDVAEVAFCFMSGVRHSAAHRKISILDKSCECISLGYKSVSINIIDQ
jgi:hypothetical protein